MNPKYTFPLNPITFNSVGFPILWARLLWFKFIFAGIIITSSLLAASAILAQSFPKLTITVQENEGIRDLAQKYLGDPDLWGEILKSNNLASAAEIRAGMPLSISADLVQLSKQQLQSALQAIQSATEAGAKVFAADTIASAITRYDEAVAQRQNGEWQKSIALARAAKIQAETARRETLAKRNTTGVAELTDRKGAVESRKPADTIWKDAPLQTKLTEGEMVRTLSSSLAEITFHDESRIRLNENSQAVIQKMRQDLLEKRKESSVSLVTGNAFALLASNQKKKNFDFVIPGMTTKVNSKNFWVQKDEKTTKVANYEGQIELTAMGATVVVGENQGAFVQANQRPSLPQSLLPSPNLLLPKNNLTSFETRMTFSWEAITGAVDYWLEISRDKSFTNVIFNNNAIKSNSFATTLPSVGSYYWRVAATDANGFPSRFSERGFFNIASDTTAPFLQLTSPEEAAIVRENSVRVAGATEKDATLFLNTIAIAVAPDGKFQSEQRLRDGANEIILEARDQAGNASRIRRTVTYVADSHVGISYSLGLKALRPKHFVVPTAEFTLRSRSTPLSLITLQRFATRFQMRTFADNLGDFQFNIPNLAGTENFGLTVLTPAGYSVKDTFAVEVDNTPPAIKLAAEPPAVSSADTLRLAGMVSGATSFKINEKEIKLVNEQFAEIVRLQTGANLIRLTATDFAGNVATMEKRVVLDQEPPTLVQQQVTPLFTTNAKLLQISVKAQDASAMKRTAKYVLQTANFSYTGYLKFNHASQAYEETVTLPKDAPEGIKLKSVVLEDYCGNKKEYQLN